MPTLPELRPNGSRPLGPVAILADLAPTLTRRASLRLGLGAVATPFLAGVGLGCLPAEAVAADGDAVHGLSIFGDLALPVDFPHLPYVDPAAPKGGEIRLQITSTSGNQNFLTFNTLNIFNLRGDGAAGVGASFDSLMTGSADEPDALYGLIARAVQVSPDRNSYRFLLRKEARFHDGSPLTAGDVKFSLETLRDHGHPTFWIPLRHDLDGVEAAGDDVVVVKLKPGHSRDVILFIAGLPVFSSRYYARVPFDEVSLEPPLGSGAYKVGAFGQGKYITMDRVPDYWAKDLPINVGTANFDRIRYEYYADRSLAFEGFKTGAFTFHEELTSRIWAKGYDIPPIADGRMLKTTIPDDYPNGTQGWFMNTRRDKFKDARVREALGYAFDFRWTNTNIMYGSYGRTVSYFQNSPMAATGTPSPAELRLLEPFRAKLSPAVFDAVPLPPESDGSGSDRALLRKGLDLLLSAGCKRSGQTLVLPDGSPFDIEFLDSDPSLEPHTLPFIRNLKLLGISANVRVIDPAQYKQRTDKFDFDIVVQRFGFGLTPGASMRDAFGSEAAAIPSSRNLCGIHDPVLDALIEKAIVADDRETLTVLCRCIDRILRTSHYWVPMWNKSGHWVAYWDLFGKPKQTGKYGLNAISTWWYDEAKAKKTALRSG